MYFKFIFIFFFLLSCITASKHKGENSSSKKNRNIASSCDLHSAIRTAIRAKDYPTLSNLLSIKTMDIEAHCGRHTPLEFAVYYSGDMRVIEMLILAGAKVHPSIIQRAVCTSYPQTEQIISTLVSKIDADFIRQAGPACSLCLFSAINCGQLKNFQTLLKLGADINFKEPQRGYTPLHYTVLLRNQISINENEHRDRIHFVISVEGMDYNAQDFEGNTAMHLTQYPEIIKTLHQAGVNLNIKNDRGYTPLQYAKKQDTAQTFLELGAEFDSTSVYDYAVISIISKHENLDTVRTLLHNLIDTYEVVTEEDSVYQLFCSAAQNDDINTMQVLAEDFNVNIDFKHCPFPKEDELNYISLSLPDGKNRAYDHYYKFSGDDKEVPYEFFHIDLTPPQCPKFIIKQQILRDTKSSLAVDSPNEICSIGIANNLNHFENAGELESYLQGNPFFSELNKNSSLPHFSSCLSQGVSVPMGLGKTSYQIQKQFLSENKKKLAVAEYYFSLKRLKDGVERALQNITAIDLMIGENAFLEDVSCNSFDSLSRSVKNQCTSVKQCSNTEDGKNSSSKNILLEESAKDTLLALQGIETIEREIKRLEGPRGRNLSKNREKIEELRERQKSIQSLYPWTLGKEFKEGYKMQDYVNYAESSEEDKRDMIAQMAGLIKNQLTHTRVKLKERKEDFLKASACIKGEESLCNELDMKKVLANTPPINHEDVFERDRQEELKSKLEEGGLSSKEEQEYRRLLTKVSEADGLFTLVGCLQTQREAVKDVNKALALGALDVGILVGTMGLGLPAVAGRFAVRVGIALSKAKELSKTKMLQNLGVFGVSASFSALYMRGAMNVCEDEINQLEETVNKNTGKVCEKLPVGAKHTSDVKSCLLQVSLASLPITVPLLGLSGRVVVKGVSDLVRSHHLGGKVSNLTQNQLKALGDEVVGDFTRRQIEALGNRVSYLTPSQLRALGNKVSYLTQNQLRALGDKVKFFTLSQFEALGDKMRFLTQQQRRAWKSYNDSFFNAE